MKHYATPQIAKDGPLLTQLPHDMRMWMLGDMNKLCGDGGDIGQCNVFACGRNVDVGI